MHRNLSPDDLRVLHHEADAAAHRVGRRCRLPGDQIADIRQDLLLDLLKRLTAFDPSRGTLGAFAGVVARNEATRLIAGIMAERHAAGGAILSLDAPLGAGSESSLGDLLSQETSLSAWLGQPADAFEAVERRIDVERALGALPRRDAALAARLAFASADRLARDGLAARASLYRRIRDLRFALAAAGLQAA